MMGVGSGSEPQNIVFQNRVSLHDCWREGAILYRNGNLAVQQRLSYGILLRGPHLKSPATALQLSKCVAKSGSIKPRLIGKRASPLLEEILRFPRTRLLVLHLCWKHPSSARFSRGHLLKTQIARAPSSWHGRPCP